MFVNSGPLSGIDTGDIGHSVRLRRSASAYFSKTLAAPTNNKKWTWSGWVKRSEIGVAHGLFDRYVGSVDFSSLYISSDNRIYFYTVVTGPVDYSVETAVNSFRDTTGHVNVTFVFDSDNAVQADRAIIYISGVRQTVTNTYGAIPSGHTTYLNTAAAHSLGRLVDNSRYMDGYLSRVCFVDGQALDPTAFGYFNTTINEWVSKTQAQIKAVVDAGGTNSFMLDFDNATSLTTLGYDKSSKGNNWTLNNFSLTAGSTYDWCLDVPGNSYSVWNSIYPAASPNFINLSNAGITSTHTVNTQGSIACGSIGIPPGDGMYYFEVLASSVWGVSNGFAHVGLSDGWPYTLEAIAPVLGWGAQNINAYQVGCTAVSHSLTATTAGAIFRFAYKAATGELWIQRNAEGWIGGGDPAAGTTPTVYGLPTDKTYFPHGYTSGHSSASNSNSTIHLCAGQLPLHASATYDSASGGYFRYAPPTGFKALCQANLPDPAILNPEKHFDVLLHSGNTSTQNVTGAQFQPDLAWIKSRNTNYWNFLYDSVRGATKALVSNSTNAEATYAAGLTGFLSNGISLGNQLDVNGSTYTYVDWLWKAGGAAVTNNAGTVSAQVSANVNAGFSIATFASPAAGDFSIGHGLPKAPGLVIAKATNGNTFNWAVFHVGVCTNGQFLRLNTTDAKQTPGGNVWGAAIPSATLVNLTATGAVEASKNCVVYSFAEIPGFSKIFSYTGNGSADGPFVHCGFKPKFIMYKRSDAASNWVIWDSVRSPDNVVNDYLLPNSSGAEATLDTLDITSNGFKLRTSNADNNGGTIIFYAVADVPGKYALAR